MSGSYLVRAGRYYYSGRTTFLELSIFFLAAWVFFGFDSGIAGSIGAGPIGMGFHWSTLLSITLSIYIMLINYHVNGLNTLTHLKNEFRRDLKYVFRWTKKSRKKGNNEYSLIESNLGSFRARFLSVCVAVIGLFVFELPWSWLYNWFQFGDIWFPIYYLVGEGVGLYRNFVLLFGALYVFVLIVYILPTNIMYKLYFVIRYIRHINFKVVSVMLLQKTNYKISYRLKGGLIILLVGCLCFGVWIMSPQDLNLERHYDDSHILNYTSPEFILPQKTGFPQTIYTYYNSSYLESYTMDNIGAYWVNDNWIHFLNVLTKTVFFIGITYMFAGKVDKKNV